MNTGRLFHVGLTVSDIHRSMRFYRDCVDMEVIKEPHESQNVVKDELLGGVGLRVEVCWLRDGNFLLQLVQYVTGAGTPLALHHSNVGTPHLSFIIDDVDAKYSAMSARDDVSVTSPVLDMGTARTFYIADPDGVPVEFCEFKVVPENLQVLMESIRAGFKK